MGFCVHHVPGRARFKLPALKGGAARFSALSKSLMAQDGILDLQPNFTTGSLIVHYDCAETDLSRIQTTLSQFRLVTQPSRRPISGRSVAPIATSMLGMVGGVVGRAVFTAVLERTVGKGVTALVGRY